MMLALIKSETTCWEVYNDLGTMMFSDQNWDNAVYLLENAVKRAPDPVIPLSNLIETYCASNRPALALMTLAELSQHIPKSKNIAPAIRDCMTALVGAEV